MPTKKFNLATTEEEVREQLTGFFERAVKARCKFDLYCEKVGVPSQAFWDANLNLLATSPAFLEYVNAVRNTFKLPSNSTPQNKPVLDFGGVKLNVPNQQEKK